MNTEGLVCGCGEPAKYMTLTGEACNEYFRCSRVPFLSMEGPLILWFDGEGRDCIRCDSPMQIIDYLLSDEGASLADVFGKEELISEFYDDDNWSFDEDNRPFMFTMGLGEISWVHVIAYCRTLESQA